MVAIFAGHEFFQIDETPMPPIAEADIQAQFTKIFGRGDWKLFKETADYYFDFTAKLLTTKINAPQNRRLLIRNIQKRLSLGIGTELLLKAIYLKHGYYINKPFDSGTHPGMLHALDTVAATHFKQEKTFQFYDLATHVHSVVALQDKSLVTDALTILRTFRNKEGHVVTKRHQYNRNTYRQIEKGIVLLYKDAFNEQLTFKIAMETGERGNFLIS